MSHRDPKVLNTLTPKAGILNQSGILEEMAKSEINVHSKHYPTY